MEEEKYIIPANPEYSEEIRKLQDSDPASASTVFNPLIERLIENTAAVRRMLTADQIMMPDGVTTVSTSLSQKAALSTQETVEKTDVPSRTVELAASELPAYIASLPRLLTEHLYIKASGSMTAPSINFDGFYGSGSIRIVQADNNAVFQTQAIMNYCSVHVIFNGIHFQCPDTLVAGNDFYGIRAVYCKLVEVANCSFSGGAHKSAYTAINCNVGTMMSASNIRADNCGTVALASNGGVLTFNGANGTDALHDNITGAFVFWGGVITLYGNTPDLLGGTTNLKHGGIIAKPNGTLL